MVARGLGWEIFWGNIFRNPNHELPFHEIELIFGRELDKD